MSVKPIELARHERPIAPFIERTLTELDAVRLRRMLQRQPPHDDVCDAVETLLDTATVVPSARVPADVVTMCSQVCVVNDEARGEQLVTLCYPQDVDPARGFISVFSPLGLALLGLREGDVVTWTAPQGAVFTSRVKQVIFQPEASGELTR